MASVSFYALVIKAKYTKTKKKKRSPVPSVHTSMVKRLKTLFIPSFGITLSTQVHVLFPSLCWKHGAVADLFLFLSITEYPSDQMESIWVFSACNEVVVVNGFRLFAGSQVNMKKMLNILTPSVVFWAICTMQALLQGYFCWRAQCWQSPPNLPRVECVRSCVCVCVCLHKETMQHQFVQISQRQSRNQNKFSQASPATIWSARAMFSVCIFAYGATDTRCVAAADVLLWFKIPPWRFDHYTVN